MKDSGLAAMPSSSAAPAGRLWPPVAALAPFLVIAAQSRRQRLHEKDTFAGTPYSFGQLLSVAANSAVVMAVLLAANGSCAG